MTTLGYLLALIGAMAIRQVVVGRAHEIPSDGADLISAVLNADSGAVSEVLSRRGTNVDAGSAAGSPSDPASTSSHSASALVNEVKKLGEAAKGYRLGTTGPDYYDCSGLVWRALKNLGMYNGSRFTTSTIQSAGFTKVSSPGVGDIVVWPAHHMGVVDGEDSYYSAHSPSSGIHDSSISGDVSYFGSSPVYWRVIAPSGPFGHIGGVGGLVG